MSRLRISPTQLKIIQVNAHDDATFPPLAFDKDPQGMGMPYKEFVVEDNPHHLVGKAGRRVRYDFPNGYGASVVMGEIFHCDAERPYEIGILHNGKLDYRALGGVDEDVLEYQTDADLMLVLAKLMALPKEQV